MGKWVVFTRIKLFANFFFRSDWRHFAPGEEKNNKNNEGRSKFVVNVCLDRSSGVSSVRCKASLMKLVEWKILENTGYHGMVVNVHITRAILDGFSHYSYKYHKPWLLDLPTYTRSILDG